MRGPVVIPRCWRRPPGRRLVVVGGAFALLAACAAPPPPPPATPVARALPEGCGGDFAGRWVLASDPSWSYRASDDGGTVVLDVERHWADGGTPDRASSARVVLRRTASGLTGETRAPRMGATGPGCEASLPVELTGCPDGGLLLRTVERMRVDGQCAAVDASPPETRSYLLVRPPSDAGT
ncbi:MAG TPA: hypothetical protein VLT82_17635 [Myxococcaceae bacterium]|nr:hypothetical protein [Myxococcaceae bacterium]